MNIIFRSVVFVVIAFGCNNGIHGMNHGNDGKFVVTGSHDKTAKMWNQSDESTQELTNEFSQDKLLKKFYEALDAGSFKNIKKLIKKGLRFSENEAVLGLKKLYKDVSPVKSKYINVEDDGLYTALFEYKQDLLKIFICLQWFSGLPEDIKDEDNKQFLSLLFQDDSMVEWYLHVCRIIQGKKYTEESESCLICTEDYSNEVQRSYLIPCGHHMCFDCIKQAAHSKSKRTVVMDNEDDYEIDVEQDIAQVCPICRDKYLLVEADNKFVSREKIWKHKADENFTLSEEDTGFIGLQELYSRNDNRSRRRVSERDDILSLGGLRREDIENEIEEYNRSILGNLLIRGSTQGGLHAHGSNVSFRESSHSLLDLANVNNNHEINDPDSLLRELDSVIEESNLALERSRENNRNDESGLSIIDELFSGTVSGEGAVNRNGVIFIDEMDTFGDNGSNRRVTRRFQLTGDQYSRMQNVLNDNIGITGTNFLDENRVMNSETEENLQTMISDAFNEENQEHISEGYGLFMDVSPVMRELGMSTNILIGGHAGLNHSTNYSHSSNMSLLRDARFGHDNENENEEFPIPQLVENNNEESNENNNSEDNDLEIAPVD